MWPTVSRGETRLTVGDPGYRDALCSLIGSEILSTTEAVQSGFAVVLDRGAVLVKPTWDELRGPEIAHLSGLDDQAWMVWRPGEESFECLR